jgi:hypothetical protein
MIGPPGLSKPWRRSIAAPGRPVRSLWWREGWKWAAGLYLAGVIAHFGHHMAFDLPDGIGPSLTEALSTAPTSLFWPADLIGTVIASG